MHQCGITKMHRQILHTQARETKLAERPWEDVANRLSPMADQKWYEVQAEIKRVRTARRTKSLQSEHDTEILLIVLTVRVLDSFPIVNHDSEA